MNTAFPVPHFDAELISRHDQHGPRYTSYPTALHFHPDFDQAALEKAIDASNGEPVPSPLSLYVHVPFCRSPCFYCGCSRVITRDPKRADALLHALAIEAALIGPRFDQDRQVRQLHLGGGTPNFLDLPRMTQLFQTLRECFAFAPVPQREFGIEIDPRFADADYIRGLGELGFNRLSAGIQDFDPVVQLAVNGEQSITQTRMVLQTAREAGFQSISVDLIYGLPKQTLDGFGETLDEIVRLSPDRVAVYGYAHLPELFKAQGQIDATELPSPAQRLDLLGMAMTRLTGAGYLYIGMDHFAKPDDSLVQAQSHGKLQRNFQGYSTLGDCDIVGLGPSAISRIGDSYSQNTRDLDGYCATLNTGRLPVARGILLNVDDIIRRDVISTLMCHGELDLLAIGERHDIDAPRYFANEIDRLKALAADGLVTIDSRFIRVQPRGRLLMRNIAMCFDNYLDRRDSAKPLGFSRTI
ncbi:MAG: oxygen-independent coproporphyrinogen III oxidase [Rhodanobacter sp.]